MREKDWVLKCFMNRCGYLKSLEPTAADVFLAAAGNLSDVALGLDSSYNGHV